MAVMLDLIGSTMIAGLVILMGLRVNQTILENSDASRANVNVQTTMTSIAEALESDFRKIGYGVPEGTYALLDTGATSIRYMADIDNSGTVDTVHWWVGPLVHAFPNDSIRNLYQQINNNSPIQQLPGVTRFGLRYLDQDGNTAGTMGQICIIEITLQVQSPYKVADQVKVDASYDDPGGMGYSTAFWRQTRLSSRNLRRHG